MLEKIEVEVEPGMWLGIYYDSQTNSVLQVVDSKGEVLDDLFYENYMNKILDALEWV